MWTPTRADSTRNRLNLVHRGSPTGPIQITPGIPPRTPSPTGEVVFDQEPTLSVSGGYDQVIMGDSTGTLTRYVDDEMIATITRPNGTQVVHSHDFSNGCSGVVTGARDDLTPYAQVGPNTTWPMSSPMRICPRPLAAEPRQRLSVRAGPCSKPRTLPTSGSPC